MLRPASRLIVRSSALRTHPTIVPTRRFLNTPSATRTSRSWKSAALRWGLAIGAVYYYNTSNLFAEEPAYIHQPPETEYETETLPTVDSLAEQRRQRAALASADARPASTGASDGTQGDVAADPGSVEGLEEEADQQGAFNPETGEINWDCPCLGGMAHGPCGEEFKAAFSCFVYSKEEPKGMDCVDKFKGMQDCFRRYPDVYGAEFDEDDEEHPEADIETPGAGARGDEPPSSGSDQPPSLSNVPEHHERAEMVANQKAEARLDPQHKAQANQERVESAEGPVDRAHEPVSESQTAVPKALHDSTSSDEAAEK